jgi:hypothetical protein
MLAIEKREKEVALERLEALQIYYRSKIASSSYNDTPPIPTIRDPEIHVELEVYETMSSAISNFRIDYRTLRDEIHLAFTDDKGKLFHTMQPHEFVRKLYNISEKVSKKETELLTQKFFDGVAVSIDDFINFFNDKRDEFEQVEAKNGNKQHFYVEHNHDNIQKEDNEKDYDQYDDNENDDNQINDNKNDNKPLDTQIKIDKEHDKEENMNTNSDEIEITDSNRVFESSQTMPPPKPQKKR